MRSALNPEVGESVVVDFFRMFRCFLLLLLIHVPGEVWSGLC